MKTILILLTCFLISGGAAQEKLSEPGSANTLPFLKVPADSPLAVELAEILKRENLEVGTKLVIEIIASDNIRVQPAVKKEAVRPGGLLNLASYSGKAGTLKNSSQAATRSGGAGRLQVVALAPVDAVTCLERPRLWWYQSADSEAKELEFCLYEMTAGEEILLTSSKSPALKAGYNKIDLGQNGANPKGVKLRDGGIYRWTINIRSDGGVVPVYAHLRHEKNGVLERSIQNAKSRDLISLSKEGLDQLAESKNWYELFDLAATSVRWERTPEGEKLRSRLLSEAGLLGVIDGIDAE